ncbi:MAG: ABC transporter ATP-binding protein [Spirochaetales bacterium]|nr:ABC transporter ATP-binding protein [Spirochaetales bacterium]
MILRLEKVEFNYASRNILNGISFTLKSNEIIALLGPNGVGKTTLLKCINRILKIRSGSIFIDEEDLNTLGGRAIAQKMGYVAQRNDTARQTVFDAVLLGRQPHMGFRISQKDMLTVSAILQRLNLNDLSLRYIDELSGGELQKVCIARALVQEPKLLLLDEPTTSLDLKNQIEILALIKEIATGHDVSVIMSVHDLNMAIHYADRFIFLKDNVIFAVCTKNDITEKLIQEVYGIDVSIHYTEEYPVVIPAKY